MTVGLFPKRELQKREAGEQVSLHLLPRCGGACRLRGPLAVARAAVTAESAPVAPGHAECARSNSRILTLCKQLGFPPRTAEQHGILRAEDTGLL